VTHDPELNYWTQYFAHHHKVSERGGPGSGPRGGPSGHTEWMNECVPDAEAAGFDEDQAIAICLHIFDAREKPGRDEAHDDFMERCVEMHEGGNTSEEQAIARCEALWNKNYGAPRRGVPETPRGGDSDCQLLTAQKAFDPDEPRDPHGRWTDGGNATDDHPGEGYSKDAYVDAKGVIHTNNVHDAARALAEDRKVELKQPKQVSTLIKELGKQAQEFKKQGKTAPVYNLCNVSVAGTNLFCAQTKGIPRIKMPQMDDEQTKAFRQYLKDKGYKIEKGKEFAANLRATQNEVNGAKVAAIMEKLQEKPEHQSKRLIISRDDYILDGHHHWAGKLGLDAADGDLTNDTKLKIARVDIPIIKLLQEAEKFTGGKGHKPATEETTSKDAPLDYWLAYFHEYGVKQPGHDVSDEPRDPGGKWTSGGGGGEAEHAIDPAVIAVGGDEWNKATAKRLEAEYKSAKPAIEKIAQEGIGEEAPKPGGEDDEDEIAVPEEWDMMSNDQQEEAKEHYIKHNHESYLDSETQNWMENDAPYEAKTLVANDFNDGGETDWADEALTELNEAREENGEPKIPYTNEQLIEALTIDQSDAAQGYEMSNTKGLDISFDDDKLKEPSNAPPPEQMTLPGVEPEVLSEHLTDEMRKDIVNQIEAAFIERAEKIVDNITPPDYLGESADEYLEQDWDSNMSDKQKFKYVTDNTEIISDLEKEVTTKYGSEGYDYIVAMPNKFDPLNETSGNDYRRTQALARYLSIHRAAEVLKARDLLPSKEELVAVDSSAPYLKENASALESYLEDLDGRLWRSWKDSSTSQNGQLLQLATADELGGRLREEQLDESRDALQAMANKRYEAIGGYKGVKAYVRAKWEVTQYLLDKANVKELPLYRGIVLPAEDVAKRFKQAVTTIPFLGGGSGRLLPNMHVERNGAASTTTDPSVANNWKGKSAGKIVLRALVPRTAAVSVPAYGINMQSEHEVVVAGTAWKGWDAWHQTAPTFDRLPLQQHAA
jgi:hypothetical protein